MYAKIFSQIMDSSIADDFGLRHFFMDLLVLADQNGVVDMTPSAISARTRIPIEQVQTYLKRLEDPDPESRTPDHNGSRIIKFDSHRSWGWIIVNYMKFRDIARDDQRKERSRAAMERFRTVSQNEQTSQNQAGNGMLTNVSPAYVSVSVSESVSVPSEEKSKRFVKPNLETVKLHGAKIGLPAEECEKFFNYYESNGWRVGRNPMVLWTAAMANWKRHWSERPASRQSTTSQPSLFQPSIASKLKAIDDLIERHPANRSKTTYDPKCTPDKVAELKNLRKQKEDLQRQLALT